MAAGDFVVLVLLCWGVLGTAVGAHATKNGRHGPFWFVLVLLTGVLGTAVYGLAIIVSEVDDADPVEVDDPIPEE